MRVASTALVLMMGMATRAEAATPADMPANSWLAVPDSKLEAVRADPVQFPGIEGNGFYTIVDAWNGAILDTARTRLVIWGGGHNDYYGNEMYVFDIPTLAWSRITDPTVEWNNCGDPNTDGTANSRHTYNGMAYIEHADRMFVTGGALNCTSGSCGAELTWTFDFDALGWTNQQPSGSHDTQCENNAAYDPASKRVYFGDDNGLFSYDYDTNAWTQHNDDYIYAMTSTIDTVRGLLVMVGNDQVLAYDIKNQNFTAQMWTTTGGDALVAESSPGLSYDPVTDRVVGWAGGPVLVLDPNSKEWTAYNPPGAPEPTQQGIFGRFRYVPTVNAFIVVTATDVDVHFFKLSEGGMLPEPTGAGGGATTATTGGGGATTGTSGAGGASAAPPGEESGCGCRLGKRSGRGGLLALLVLAVAWRRSRRVCFLRIS